MLKKLLAGLTAIVLSLGIVAVTVSPASAHHTDVDASFDCTGPSAGTITWTVHNWDGDKEGRVWSSTGNLVPAGTIFASDETKTFTQNVTATGTYSLSVTMRWYIGTGDKSDLNNWKNETTNSDSITLNSGSFSDCQPDDTDRKINVCHYNNGGGGSWTVNEVSISSVINGTGHGGHNSDIIPSFSYVKQGVPGNYLGKNWTTYGQNVWNAGCKDVTPPPPTFTDAACTGPGTWGQGSYTIPSVTGARYLVSINDGPWVEKGQGNYPVPVGTKVEVKAEDLPNYDLAGSDSQWEWSDTISKPSTCDENVTPTKPTTTQAVCTAEGQVAGAGYTIPNITGVQYQRSTGNSNGPWVNIDPGTYPTTDGTSVWIRAIEKTGYELVGNDDDYKWKLEFTDVDSSKCVVPANPTPTYSQCTAPGQASIAKYNIPNDTGIQYQRWTGSSWVNIGSGDVTVTTPATVQLRAVAKTNYTIVGGPYTWTFDFAKPDCIEKVVPADPTFTDAQCAPQTTGITQGGYFIPTTPNVSYTVSIGGGAAVPATTGVFVPVAPGVQVQIAAIAATNYTLKDYTGPWSHTFANPGECLDDATAAKAIFTDSICKDPGTGATDASYQVVAAANVTYEVSTNGVDYTPIAVDTYPGVIGQTVYIRAVPAAGYQLVGYDGPWSHTFVSPGDCLDEATAAKAIFTDSICKDPGTGATDASYQVVAAANVTYEVSTNGVDYTPIAVDTYPGVIGQTVYIRAVPAAGYQLVGYDGPWSHTFVSPGDCLDTTPVDAVTKVDQTCIVIDDVTRGGKFGATLLSATGVYVTGWITIPTTPNVDYFIEPDMVNPAPAGKNELPPGVYTVHAVAHSGYTLDGYTGPWVLEIENAEACGDLVDLPVVTPVVSFVQTGCLVAGSYTLGVEQDGLEDGVIWTVTGGLPNTLGTHSVTSPGIVTITATPADGYGFTENDGPDKPVLTWEYDFSALPDDCLPTLALTGGGLALGGFGLAAVLLVGGALLIGSRGRVGRPMA